MTFSEQLTQTIQMFNEFKQDVNTLKQNVSEIETILEALKLVQSQDKQVKPNITKAKLIGIISTINAKILQANQIESIARRKVHSICSTNPNRSQRLHEYANVNGAMIMAALLEAWAKKADELLLLAQKQP